METNTNAVTALGVLGMLIISLTPGFVRANTQVSTQQVSFTTSDGVTLTGQLLVPTPASTKLGIIIIPGGWRGGVTGELFFSPYQNYSSIPTLLAVQGYTVLSVNMRSVRNFSTSLFEDSVKDIDAAVRYMKGIGFTSILLAGHSIGTDRAGYYETVTKETSIVAIGYYATGINLATAAQQAQGQQNYSKITNQASALIAQGQGTQIVYTGQVMPAGPGQPSPESFSAQTWLSWIGPNTSSNQLRWIRNISVPIIMLAHTKDVAAQRSQSFLYNYSVSSGPRTLKLYTANTTGNAHYFQGFENQVAQDTVNWLQSLPSTTSTTTSTTSTTTTSTSQSTSSTSTTVPEFPAIVLVPVMLAGLILVSLLARKSLSDPARV